MHVTRTCNFIVVTDVKNIYELHYCVFDRSVKVFYYYCSIFSVLYSSSALPVVASVIGLQLFPNGNAIMNLVAKKKRWRRHLRHKGTKNWYLLVQYILQYDTHFYIGTVQYCRWNIDDKNLL